jgi:hypothetical protein
LRHDKVIAEGWWKPYRENYNHILYSLSKSFTSTAVGFAVQEGLLTVEDYVLDIFKDKLPCTPCENMQKMKVKHLLMMSTGHSKEINAYSSEDWIYAFLSSYIDNKPGSMFVYNNPAAYMLSAIVQKQTGVTILEYLKPRLFEPLGFSEDIWWENSPQGINLGFAGFNIKTEDIAKFGVFLLNRGKWESKQLLAAEWIDEASAKHIETKDEAFDWRQGYGYQFWRCLPENAYRADGAFGQFCIVMPNQDMVIAVTAGSQKTDEILEAAWKYLIPAIKDSIKPDSEMQNSLENKLKSLEIPVPKCKGTSDYAVKYSDKVYQIAENPLGIIKLSFHFGEKSSVAITTKAGTLKADLGYEEWIETETGYDSGGFSCLGKNFFSDTACAGAWEDDVFTLKLSYTRTPFVDTMKIKFDECGIAVDFQHHVKFIRTSYTMMGRE